MASLSCNVSMYNKTFSSGLSRSLAIFVQNFTSTTTSSKLHEIRKPKTGILMLNMGGPNSLDEVGGFLHRLFTDRDIISLPFQSQLGPYIAKRRTPDIIKKYKEIGGCSPIHKWTKIQGALMVEQLDQLCPESAPHKFYVGFRYANPLTEDTLREMEKDGIERAVAFSQYPQYCCSTTGSSLNAIYNFYNSLGTKSNINWSIIDRWPSHSGLLDTFAENIRAALKKFPDDVQKNVVILFSAHSIPMKNVNKGDPYPAEVAATVIGVMKKLNWSHPYRLVWQSKVGPVQWLSPQTGEAMEGFVKLGFKNQLIVPIAFTSDHIETLHELDIEYCKELAEKIGVNHIHRAAAPNDNPIFVKALADIVKSHLNSESRYSPQMMLRCPLCTKSICYKMRKWFSDH